ncbi:hypothetical protein J15TS10_17450 [Paenibacillus woosongensis]|uniref:YolD-like family protein n=2 Tax=Paenibacillus woosongensis TaxID=307580 RepID=A0ABQ4MPK8_9BACL|nr:hypothetical protein J15TS10_17450 [Paenibacillus woosongensis]
MIMPQHREAAQQQIKEESMRKRVELCDQEKEQIGRFILQSYKTRQPVKLRMYDEYEEVYVIGVVERVDSLRFRVDGEWFALEDITELAWAASVD